MAVDIIARGMAASAAGAASQIADSFTTGFSFAGAVDYESDLPTSGNSNGDLIVVKYVGNSGTAPLNARYAWGNDGGTDKWILIDAGATDPYELTFNASGSWTQSGTKYTITVAAADHLHGTTGNITIWRQKSGGNYEIGTGAPSDGYILSIDGSGNVTITVDSNGRFAGKIVIN